jgi:hypothetical protein
MASYLGIFVCSEIAFLLMAVQEYLQDLLRMNEEALIRDTPLPGNVKTVDPGLKLSEISPKSTDS